MTNPRVVVGLKLEDIGVPPHDAVLAHLGQVLPGHHATRCAVVALRRSAAFGHAVFAKGRALGVLRRRAVAPLLWVHHGVQWVDPAGDPLVAHHGYHQEISRACGSDVQEAHGFVRVFGQYLFFVVEQFVGRAAG